MKPHCNNCLSERPQDVDIFESLHLEGYSACCNDRVCDGLEYDVRVAPDGEEVMGFERDEPVGTKRVRTCCIHRARIFFGL